MGVYDRDWWREHYNKHHGPQAQQPEQDTEAAFQHVAHQPKKRPPDMPGVDWHWTIKLLAFCGFATVMLILAKHIAPILR
ncbi:hypothetical protein [Cupriavidus campinensis]